MRTDKEIRGMNIFSNLGKKSLSEQAVDQILYLISRGVLKPGEKFPSEREMSESMSISRAPLREALTALGIAGILETKAGSGRYVSATPSLDISVVSLSMRMIAQEAPFQIMEARFHFEPEAAALAAERATPEVISDLRSLIEIMEGLKESGEWDQKYDRDFHVVLAEATQNIAMYNTIVSLCDIWFNEETPWKSAKKDGLLTPERLEYICNIHRQIVESVANHDVEGARRAMQKNFDHIFE
jgi:DNA-binding FadR family transcriptional regulator